MRNAICYRLRRSLPVLLLPLLSPRSPPNCDSPVTKAMHLNMFGTGGPPVQSVVHGHNTERGGHLFSVSTFLTMRRALTSECGLAAKAETGPDPIILPAVSHSWCPPERPGGGLLALADATNENGGKSASSPRGTHCGRQYALSGSSVRHSRPRLTRVSTPPGRNGVGVGKER